MSHPSNTARRIAAAVSAVALGGMLALGSGVQAHAGDNYPGARAAGNLPGAHSVTVKHTANHPVSWSHHH